MALRTRSDWIKLAQHEFNAFIRYRDRLNGCISCPVGVIETVYGGSFDCGHFLTIGAHPELRYEELNAHKQCKKCNGGSGRFRHKDKTVSQKYEANLILKIGQDKVDWLKGPHEPKNYTIDDLKEIRRVFKERLKMLEEG